MPNRSKAARRFKQLGRHLGGCLISAEGCYQNTKYHIKNVHKSESKLLKSKFPKESQEKTQNEQHRIFLELIPSRVDLNRKGH